MVVGGGGLPTISGFAGLGGEASSKIGSNVRKNQGALPIAEARREEGAAQLQGKRGCSTELPR